MSRGALFVHGRRRSLPSPLIPKSISSANAYAPLMRTNPSFFSSSSSFSPFLSNLIRVLRNEIQYQRDYAPPHQCVNSIDDYIFCYKQNRMRGVITELNNILLKRRGKMVVHACLSWLKSLGKKQQPVTNFDRFMVEDQPGKQWIMLRGKSSGDENIKIEATMFDGLIFTPKSGDTDAKGTEQLHISVLVDIWKEGGTDIMEFVCSALPDSLEIRKVYTFKLDEPPVQLYLGPDIKKLSTKLQSGFYKFLKTRGVNSGLSKFLHEYMMNKDRIELIQWLEKVRSYIER